MAAGIPQHLRGAARLVIDSGMSGADIDLDSAATHTIEGLAWVADSNSPTSAVAGAGGTRVSGDSATSYELRAAIPGSQSSELLCVIAEFTINTMDKNGQTIWLKVSQGASDTVEDVMVTYRRVASDSFRHRPGYRNSGGGWTLGYIDDNPHATSIGRVQLMLTGHGMTWRSVCGNSAAKAGFNGVVATNGGTGRVITRGAGNVAAGLPSAMTHIAVGWNFYSDDLDVTLEHVSVYRAGIL